MATKVDAALLSIYRAAGLVETGIWAEMKVAMAKYFAAETEVEVVRNALQIHGGNRSASYSSASKPIETPGTKLFLQFGY
jgi:alkylation response protein AidB-like acyl-CoA dehydrogenase